VTVRRKTIAGIEWWSTTAGCWQTEIRRYAVYVERRPRGWWVYTRASTYDFASETPALWAGATMSEAARAAEWWTAGLPVVLVKPVVRLYRTPHQSTIPGVPNIGRRDTYAHHCRQCGGSWKVYQNRYHATGCPNEQSYRSEPPPREDWRPWHSVKCGAA
jgi:hypothetical protein